MIYIGNKFVSFKTAGAIIIDKLPPAKNLSIFKTDTTCSNCRIEIAESHAFSRDRMTSRSEVIAKFNGSIPTSGQLVYRPLMFSYLTRKMMRIVTFQCNYVLQYNPTRNTKLFIFMLHT